MIIGRHGGRPSLEKHPSRRSGATDADGPLGDRTLRRPTTGLSCVAAESSVVVIWL
jgi:hypothetical protein